MTPRGANKEIYYSDDGLEYYKDKDSQGVSRKYWKRQCQQCLEISWLRGREKALKPICIKCSNKRPISEETRKKISDSLRKNYTTPSYKEKVLAAQNRPSKESHWNWKGGITSINQVERNSEQAKQWRTSVFERDNYHCRLCKSNTNLAAHHIFPWASFPEKRFDLDNGITLCSLCHHTVHLYLKEINA